MASLTTCLAQMSRLCVSTSGRTALHRSPPLILGPAFQVRHKSKKPKGQRGPSKVELAMRAKKLVEKKKRKKPRASFKTWDMKDAEQFALCDAIRYIRAVEVGQTPTSVKYEIALRLKTLKNGPVIRNRLRLPHPVKTNIRVCVICPPDSKYAKDAREAGAALVGEAEIFEAVKAGRIEFDRCICQTDSFPALNKAALGRILGPRGLMPSAKLGTVVKDPSLLVRDFTSGAEYKERMGVIRLAVGQLAFPPEQLAKNIKTVIESIKKDAALLSDKANKEIAEIVLSSTNGPGFILSGDFKDPKSDTNPKDLAAL